MERFAARSRRPHLSPTDVAEDLRSGLESGANGTPTFFVNDQRYDGAWDLESLLELIEKPLGIRVQLLTQRFTRLAASGGIVLLICTIIALLWANSPWSEEYFHFWEMRARLSALAIGTWQSTCCTG